MKRVLFIDTTHEILPERLRAAGMVCIPFEGNELHDLIEMGDNYDGFIIRSGLNLTRDVLMNFPSLRFIGRVGAGMESIDKVAATELGITCLNSPEGNRDAVAEHAVGMLLSLFNKINIADHEVRKGTWQRESNRGTELGGKTVAIVGYGNMGTAFACRLKGFNVDVLAYDKYKKGFSDAWVREATMDEVFASADILSLHVPLTEETQHLVNESYLSSFSKDIYLINTARGPVVDTGELVKSMESGKVKGVCLDVIEYENSTFSHLDSDPQPYSYLKNSDRCILTPHVAGWSVESEVKLAAYLADKIIARFA